MNVVGGREIDEVRFVMSRNDNDRRVAVLIEGFGGPDAIFAGHVEISDDEVRAMLSAGSPRIYDLLSDVAYSRRKEAA